MVLVARGALDHWIITQAAGLAMSRIDPIVSSNSVSGHVHNIMGASNFNSECECGVGPSTCPCIVLFDKGRSDLKV